MFREVPRRGWALAAHTLSLALGAVAAGSTLAFLGMVAFGFLVEEGFRDAFVAARWDPILRAGVGVTALLLAGALGVWAVAFGAARLATLEQLARAAREHPDTVPGWSTRHLVAVKEPFAAITVLGIFGLSLGGLAVLLLVFALAETARYNPEDARDGVGILIGAVVVCLLVVLALVRRRRSWVPRWEAALATVDVTWRNRVVDAALEAERTRRRAQRRTPPSRPLLERALATAGRVGTRLGGAVLAVAVAVSLATLFGRQPCRLCDENEYGEVGESVLDVLARTSTVVLAAAAITLTAALLLSWLARLLEATRLTRLAADASPPHPDADSVAPAFREPWPTQTLGLVVTAVGGGIPLALVWSSVVSAEPTVAVVLGVVALAGVGLLAWSDGHAARSRNRMRAAWSPGDVRPPAPPRRRRVRS